MQSVRSDLTVGDPRELTLLGALASGALLSAWLILAVRDPTFDRYHLPKELALATVALVCSCVFLRRPAALFTDRIARLTWVSCVCAGIASAFATSPALALRPLSLSVALAVLFLTGRVLQSRAREALLASLVLAALGVAAVALAESYGPLAELSRPGRAPGSTIGQRNTVGHLLAIVSPLALQLGTSRGRFLAPLGCLASMALAAALLHTRSRAAWLGYGAALLVFSVLQRRARSGAGRAGGRLWLPLSAALLGLALAASIPSKLAWSSPSPLLDSARELLALRHGSGAGRLAQYQTTFSLVKLHPLLGCGPGNWMVEYPRVSPPGDPAFDARALFPTGRLANSDWLALWSEQGTFAWVIALLLGAHVARAAFHGPSRATALALLACLLVVGSLDAVLQLPASGCVVALALGTALPAPELGLESSKSHRALAAVLCAALALAVLGSTRRVVGLWARTRPHGGYEAAERALWWNGSDLLALRALAEAYTLKGDCTRARPHIVRLSELLPYHTVWRELGCREAPRPPSGHAAP